MKNRQTAALVAVIALSFAALSLTGLSLTALSLTGCGLGGNGWPPANVRGQFDIGGLNQPPDCSIKAWSRAKIVVLDQLNIYLVPTNTNDTRAYFDNWFTSNGWTASGLGTEHAISWMKDSLALTAQYMYNEDDGVGALAVSRHPE